MKIRPSHKDSDKDVQIQQSGELIKVQNANICGSPNAKTKHFNIVFATENGSKTTHTSDFNRVTPRIIEKDQNYKIDSRVQVKTEKVGDLRKKGQMSGSVDLKNQSVSMCIQSNTQAINQHNNDSKKIGQQHQQVGQQKSGSSFEAFRGQRPMKPTTDSPEFFKKIENAKDKNKKFKIAKYSNINRNIAANTDEFSSNNKSVKMSIDHVMMNSTWNDRSFGVKGVSSLDERERPNPNKATNMIPVKKVYYKTANNFMQRQQNTTNTQFINKQNQHKLGFSDRKIYAIENYKIAGSPNDNENRPKTGIKRVRLNSEDSDRKDQPKKGRPSSVKIMKGDGTTEFL